MKARLTCHSLLALSIAALLPAGSALAATTSGGTVNFSGKVVTSACAISAGSANIDVDMGKCVPPRWLPQASGSQYRKSLLHHAGGLRNRRYLRVHGK